MTTKHTQYTRTLRRMALLVGVLLATLSLAMYRAPATVQATQTISANLTSSNSVVKEDSSAVVMQQDNNCPVSDSVQCFVDQRNMEKGDGSPENPFYKFGPAYETATNLASQLGLPAQIIVNPGYYAAGDAYTRPAEVNAPNGPVVLASMPTLLGNVDCAPGDRDCNICVNDVTGSFLALPQHYELMGFDLGSHPPPPFNLDISDCPEGPWWTEYHGHWQGVQRLQSGGGRYLIVTRDKIAYPCGDATCEYAGFAVVRLDASQAMGGGPFASNRALGGPPPSGDSVDQTVRKQSEYTHPGGVQTLGDILIVGTGPVVSFYDLSDPANLQAQEPPLGELPDRGAYSGSTTAAAQLQDGRYLLAISGSDAQSLDFYISDEPYALASPTQSYVKFSRIDRYYPPPKCPALRNDWDTYQNINLVTECGSGALYLIATGNRDFEADTCWWWCGLSDNPCCPDGPNHADLYRLEAFNENNIGIAWVAETDFSAGSVDPKSFAVDPEYGCNFDAAAGVYVDPSHRLYLYCTEHADHNDGYVRFSQFGPVP